MTQQISIIGGGLAGSFLALRLALSGNQVTIFDDQSPNSASRVAAGLFNIITGRYGAKSWQAELLLKEIHDFFSNPLCQPLLQHIHYGPIFRPFKNIRDYNKWLGRSTDPSFSQLVDFHEKSMLPDQIINDLGGIMIHPCGWADTIALLKGLQQLIQKHHGSYVPGIVSYHQIHLPQKYIETERERVYFDQIVFCEGYQSKDNPFFSPVPIIPNKGDVLMIESPDLHLPFILSKKIFVIPLADQRFLVGSTYANHVTDPTPSFAAKEEICAYLDQALRMPYRVLDQKAGIRPTTPDRRPILGSHPSMNYVHICTGLGAKGMLLAPYCSRLLHLCIERQEIDIPEDIRLARFA